MDRPGTLLGCIFLIFLLFSCGPAPLDEHSYDFQRLDAPAPREILFSHSYENRRGEAYAPLSRPSAIHIFPEGGIAFGDLGTGLIHLFDSEGFFLNSSDGQGSTQLLPLDLAGRGFHLYILDGSRRQVLRFRQDGIFRDVLVDIAQMDPLQTIDPSAMAVDRDGRMALCDLAGHRVILTGPFLDVESMVGEFGSFSGQFREPRGVAFGFEGLLYVSDRGNRNVQLFDRMGMFMASTSTNEEFSQKLIAPSGMCTDRFGNVYVTDTGSGVVHVLAPDLFPLMVIGEDEFQDGHLSRPVDCAVGPGDRLYVVDAGRMALQVYDIVFP